MKEALSPEELIIAIEREFKDVSRKEGVSWLEADALDGGGQQYLFDIAKERDIESCWQELVDSPTWEIVHWSSNWSFLDPIGFKYYLAAALVRELKSGTEVMSDFHFWFDHRTKFSAFSESQKLVVAEYVLYRLLTERLNLYPDMVGQPVVFTEPFSDKPKIIDSDWANAFLAWKDYLPKN